MPPSGVAVCDPEVDVEPASTGPDLPEAEPEAALPDAAPDDVEPVAPVVAETDVPDEPTPEGADVPEAEVPAAPAPERPAEAETLPERWVAVPLERFAEEGGWELLHATVSTQTVRTVSRRSIARIRRCCSMRKPAINSTKRGGFLPSS